MVSEAAFTDVTTAVAELRAGRMIVVVDDEDRENEGDLTLAAEFCTPEAINFMAKYGRGLICLTLTEENADHLHLGPMTHENTSRFGTAFTESIEAREGVTTGISAADRAHTIQVAISPDSNPGDLARPGHVFPLRARKGGVLVRAGQTEASVDLSRIAGLNPSGVICEIMNDDGTMARVPDLIGFCREHNLKMVTVAEVIRYRLQHERYVKAVGEALLPTQWGDFRMLSYESEVEGDENHIALVYGDVSETDEPVLVRVHTHCLTGGIFGSELCDCRAVIDGSLKAIAEAGRGALLYLHHTQRGFGLDRDAGRLLLHRDDRTAERSREAHDGSEKSSSGRDQRILRQVGLGGQILSDLGIHKIILLTNHATHIPALQGFGVEIVGRRAIADTGVTTNR
ncbi:MAG: 3,4-dihydroxy-2-butanone-4-phosphate synthase [Bryocella sp.]